MGKKIFVSCKYSDANVQPLPGHLFNTTARSYVDEINALIEEGEDHIYKGENDGESMDILKFSFQILRDNMFNIVTPAFSKCNNHGIRPPYLEYSYDMDKYINIALSIWNDINRYTLVKTINC